MIYEAHDIDGIYREPNSIQYIVNNQEELTKVLQRVWDVAGGSKSIDPGISEVPVPTTWPVLVLPSLHYADGEVAYVSARTFGQDFLNKMFSDANALNSDSKSAKSSFTKMGSGRYIIYSLGGYKAAVNAFWLESGGTGKLNEYLHSSKYPFVLTLTKELSSEGELVGVIKNTCTKTELEVLIAKM